MMEMIAIAGVAATIGVAVVGWVIQRWRNKRTINRMEQSDLESTIEDNERRVSTLWRWAFGREDDETDGGLSAEIQDGFSRIEEDIGELEKKQETYHDTEMKQLYRLVNALHDEEELDIEREDVFRDDSRR